MLEIDYLRTKIKKPTYLLGQPEKVHKIQISGLIRVEGKEIEKRGNGHTQRDHTPKPEKIHNNPGKRGLDVNIPIAHRRNRDKDEPERVNIRNKHLELPLGCFVRCLVWVLGDIINNIGPRGGLCDSEDNGEKRRAE